MSNKVVVVNNREDAGVSRLEVGEGTRGARMGRMEGGDKIRFTNLRSDSSYASRSTVARVQ